MKKTLVVAFVIITWIGGCRADTEKDTLAVQHSVLRYTQLLAEGYAKMNMTALLQVATDEQALRAYHHMSALGSSKIRMESELVDIEFLDIEFPEREMASVKTREKWNYTHMNIDTTMPAQTTVEGITYTLSYGLVRKNSRWLVSSVSVIREDRPEDTLTADTPQ
jgi:hypothetical protein